MCDIGWVVGKCCRKPCFPSNIGLSSFIFEQFLNKK